MFCEIFCSFETGESLPNRAHFHSFSSSCTKQQKGSGSVKQVPTPILSKICNFSKFLSVLERSVRCSLLYVSSSLKLGKTGLDGLFRIHLKFKN